MRCSRDVSVRNYSMQTGESLFINRITRNCKPIKDLFVSAFSNYKQYNFEHRNTWVLNVKDSSRYLYPTREEDVTEWMQKNSYSYELYVAPGRAKNTYYLMQKDLELYFNIKASVEKRMIKCLVLIRTSKEDKLRTRGDLAKTNFIRKNDDPFQYLYNQPLGKLVQRLNAESLYLQLPTPVINATNYQGNIDISLKSEDFTLLHLERLRNQLNKYDLDLIETDWLCDVLVLTELPNNDMAIKEE
jgi:hypothetical protein